METEKPDTIPTEAGPQIKIPPGNQDTNRQVPPPEGPAPSTGGRITRGDSRVVQGDQAFRKSQKPEGRRKLTSFSAPALDKQKHSGPKKPKSERRNDLKHKLQHFLTSKQIKEMLNLRIAGETYEAIHKKMGIAKSTVGRLDGWRQRHPERFKAYLQKVANFENGIRTPRISENSHAIVHVPKTPHATRFTPKETIREQEIEAKRLKAQGLKIREISEKMGISTSTLNWRLYGKKRFYKKSPKDKGDSNGNIVTTSSNGDAGSAPAKNVLLGYAFCKVEQYIRFLAERTGLTEEFLKQRLPELLGHSEVRRGTSGFID